MLAAALWFCLSMSLRQALAVGEPVRVSGGAMAGHILTRVYPVLPEIARTERVSGAVVMHAIIGTDGRIKELQVISGPELLRESYLDAVRHWTYRPYLLNGVPVEVDTTITITSSLGG